MKTGDALRRMTALTRREKAFVFGGLLIILLAGFYAFVHQRLTVKRIYLEAEASQVEVEVLALRNLALQEKAMENRLREIEMEEKALERLLPSVLDAPNLLVTLDGISQAAGVKIEQIHFGTPVTDEMYPYYPISMEVRGLYPGIVKFFRLLEGVEQLVKVEGLSLTAQEGQMVKGRTVRQARVKFTLKVFVEKAEPGSHVGGEFRGSGRQDPINR